MIQTLRKNPDRWASLGLAILTLAITLPFLNHAFHIDEPLFLRIASQIKEHPWNPYGFDYLWNKDVEPMHRIAAFPPLFPYLLALIGLGRHYPSEWSIHLALLPFSMLAALSFYALSRLFNFSPLVSFLGTALLIASPSFVISANLAMPDIAMLSFTLAALALCVHGWTTQRLLPLIAGGLLLGGAALMRYNAVPAIGVFFLLGLTYAKPRRALIPSLIAFFLFLTWMISTRFVAGEFHAKELTENFASMEGFLRRFWALNDHLTLSTFLPFVALLIFWWRGPLGVLIAAFFLTDVFGVYAFYHRNGIIRFSLFPDLFFVGLGLFTFLYLVYLSFQSFRGLKWEEPNSYRNRDFRLSLFLFWIVGALALPLIYVFFASKYLLIVQPVLILLLLNQLVSRNRTYTQACFYLVPLMFLVSFFVATSDFSLADAYRKESRELFSRKEIKNSRVWFIGHWGWQYYLEEQGARPLPVHGGENETPSPGELVLTAENVTRQPFPEALTEKLEWVESVPYPSRSPLRTMCRKARAGFYSEIWGPLPYTLSDSILEDFTFYRVKDE